MRVPTCSTGGKAFLYRAMELSQRLSPQTYVLTLVIVQLCGHMSLRYGRLSAGVTYSSDTWQEAPGGKAIKGYFFTAHRSLTADNETFSTANADISPDCSTLDNILPTDFDIALRSYRDGVLTQDSPQYSGLSTTPNPFHDDKSLQDTYNDLSKDKREALDVYAFDLAEDIWNNVQLLGLRREDAEDLAIALPEFLRQMAVRLANGSTGHSTEKEAQAFVYRNRHKISDQFRSLVQRTANLDNRERASKSFFMDEHLYSRVAEWTKVVAECSPRRLYTQERAENVDIPDYGASKSVKSHDYRQREFICSSVAYRWLLSTIGRHIVLNTDTAESMNKLRGHILQFLNQRVPLLSTTPFAQIFHVELVFHWALDAFLRQQYGEKDVRLGDVITLTGRGVDAQALTCSSYLRQTWPCTGLNILGFVQAAFDGRIMKKSAEGKLQLVRLLSCQICTWMLICIWEIVGNAKVSAQFIENDQFVLNVNGVADVIAEVAEQIAWLAGSLQQSSLAFGPVSCRPRVQNITTLVKHFRVDFHYVFDKNDFNGAKPNDNGHCWYGMFRNPVVVTGYPILRRPTGNPGLEVPLNVMAGLIGGQRINELMGNRYIKGLRSMLVTSGNTTGIFNWHHLVNSNERRISYLYGRRHQAKSVLASSSSLAAARHIVGWCPNVSHQVGGPDMNYAVKRSGLPQPGREIALEKFTLGLSHIVTGGATFGIGSKDTPIHVTKGDYIGKLRWISRKYVVFWDQEDKRGWLVNGVSALLHALLGSLEFSRTDHFKTAFEFDISKFKYSKTPTTYNSAIEVLLNDENRKMILYPSSSATTTETVIDINGVATTSTKTSTTNYTVEDKVVELYEYLERMIEYKTTIETSPGIKTKLQRPLQHLEGWDFNELVSMRDPLYLRVATLGPNSFSWVKLTRSIHAITLFGKGFGNILKNAGIGDRAPCQHLSEVPTQQCYLSVGISDIMSIADNFDGDLSARPMKLTANLVWHNASYPRDAFGPCPCEEEGNDQPVFPVQQILPSKLPSRLIGPTNSLDDFKHGAVVFGQSNPLGFFRWILSNNGKCEEFTRQKLELPHSNGQGVSTENSSSMASSQELSPSATPQSPRTSQSSAPVESIKKPYLIPSDSDRFNVSGDSSRDIDGLVIETAQAIPEPIDSHSKVDESQVEDNKSGNVSSAKAPVHLTSLVPGNTTPRTAVVNASHRKGLRFLDRLRRKSKPGQVM
ncbi:hypothetical protein N8I77_003373 [Diaporthe amygdali]|uniref:Uncharacterized protein n=1 Tax=Phomopsis amygdali TaxID=1214568 RepID=A0AAD9SK33_PHOAM|nr:hypothetical protein N8I77_003373 [Diaporthe amygdali]